MHPLTSHLIPLVTSDYYDGSEMNDAETRLVTAAAGWQADTFTECLTNNHYFIGWAGEGAALVLFCLLPT